MPPVSLLIKPASGSCNMRCSYCFYVDEMAHRQVGSYGVMKEDVLEAVLAKAFAYAEGHIHIGFQGGEPTLAGLDYFHKAVELEKRYHKPGLQISNTIQTNGLIIDGAWADFLASNQFLVGLSMDGCKETHDPCRPDASGSGTFGRVLRAAQLLAARKAEVNIVTVVTPDIVRHIGKVYRFYRKNGLFYQQYIPCLDPIGGERGDPAHSLTPELYGRFLRELFQLWYIDRMAGKPVYIRYFDNLLMMLAGRQPESCGMSGRCCNQLVVEADGGVYPCDFYVLDEWRLGNIADDPLESILDSPLARQFVEERTAPHQRCGACRWYPLCRGGCKRERVPVSDDTPIYRYCGAMQDFLPFAVPKMLELLKRL